MQRETDGAHAANARAFNNWLVNDWLAAYPHHNVAVFDFYNVLTSNGGDSNTNDAGAETGNHHRIWEGSARHIQTVANDMAAYGSSTTDSHATAAGNQKATQEFPGLLNAYYHCWSGTADCPTLAPNPYGAAPAVGCNGTEIHVTGAGFGDTKGRVSLQYWNSRGRLVQRSLKILSWADALIVARVWARMEPQLSDVAIRPYRQPLVTVQNVFTAMAPAVDSITPGTGSPGDPIALAGHYFGADKPVVQFRHLVSGRLRQTRCKVTAWAMDPTTGESNVTFTVPNRLATGSYDVAVSSKIGSTVVGGGFTVP